MGQGTEVLFATLVAVLLVHELDAIRQREWRFFFAPVPLRDETAYWLFTALHAPLFAVILLYADSQVVQIGVAVFAIVHGVLHFGLRKHPLVAFDTWFSRGWIVGASVLGVLYLLFGL